MIWLNIGSILIDRFLGVNQIGDVHHGAIVAILWSLWPISNRSYRINSQNQDFDDGPVIRVVSVPLIFTIQTLFKSVVYKIQTNHQYQKHTHHFEPSYLLQCKAVLSWKLCYCSSVSWVVVSMPIYMGQFKWTRVTIWSGDYRCHIIGNMVSVLVNGFRIIWVISYDSYECFQLEQSRVTPVAQLYRSGRHCSGSTSQKII